MSAACTPGPWLVNPASAWVEVPDRDAPICSLLWPTDLRSEDETFANARLIAAAPELYYALRLLRDECSGAPDPVRLVTLLAHADTALAKVTAA